MVKLIDFLVFLLTYLIQFCVYFVLKSFVTLIHSFDHFSSEFMNLNKIKIYMKYLLQTYLKHFNKLVSKDSVFDSKLLVVMAINTLF